MEAVAGRRRTRKHDEELLGRGAVARAESKDDPAGPRRADSPQAGVARLAQVAGNEAVAAMLQRFQFGDDEETDDGGGGGGAPSRSSSRRSRRRSSRAATSSRSATTSTAAASPGSRSSRSSSNRAGAATSSRSARTSTAGSRAGISSRSARTSTAEGSEEATSSRSAPTSTAVEWKAQAARTSQGPWRPCARAARSARWAARRPPGPRRAEAGGDGLAADLRILATGTLAGADQRTRDLADSLCDAVAEAWTSWQSASTITNVRVNSVTAIGGQLIGPRSAR